MFELTNEQRRCFGIEPLDVDWERVEAKSSPSHKFKTYLYLDGDVIRHVVQSGEKWYQEWALSDSVSADRRYLLPKTDKGKPVVLSASSIMNRRGKGMCLSYISSTCQALYNEESYRNYYTNRYLDLSLPDINSFAQWVADWCDKTTTADIADLAEFARCGRRLVKFKEGDVFRFKIGRRLYGYGRILLDYARLRKTKEPFWDLYMGKPVIYSVYHIVTERDDVTVDELKGLKSLPSAVLFDNGFYYGDYPIIGNLPISNNEDYPIMYGGSEDFTLYQHGKLFIKLENTPKLYKGFVHTGIGFVMDFKLDILRQCIAAASNAPFWEQYYPHYVNEDLRNPKFKEELSNIRRQVGLEK